MNHLDRDTLNLYLDAQLSDSERAAVEQHLADCNACRAEMSAARELFTALAQWQDKPLPRDLTASVMARVAEERSGARTTRRLALVLGAQALVAFGVALWLALPRLGYLGELVPQMELGTWLAVGRTLLQVGLPIPYVPPTQVAAVLLVLVLLWLVSNHLLLGKRDARKQERV